MQGDGILKRLGVALLNGAFKCQPIDIGAFQTQSLAAAVNTTADGVVSAPGNLTLRQAINLAGALTQPVTFDPIVFGTPRVITLTDGPVMLKDKAVTINGPGSNLVSVSGGGKSLVFEIATRRV